jgi:hypothetical protein
MGRFVGVMLLGQSRRSGRRFAYRWRYECGQDDVADE